MSYNLSAGLLFAAGVSIGVSWYLITHKCFSIINGRLAARRPNHRSIDIFDLLALLVGLIASGAYLLFAVFMGIYLTDQYLQWHGSRHVLPSGWLVGIVLSRMVEKSKKR